MEAAIESTTGHGSPQYPKKSTPELMGIPVELRSKILGWLYPHTTIKVLTYHVFGKVGPIQRIDFLVPPHYRPQTVLQTCKKLFREGTEMLFQNLTLELPFLYDYRIQWWHRLPQALCVGVTKVTLIRHNTGGDRHVRPINLCALKSLRRVSYNTRIETPFETMPGDPAELYLWLNRNFQMPYCPSITLFLQSLHCKPQAVLAGEATLVFKRWNYTVSRQDLRIVINLLTSSGGRG